ncbi:MAG: hopanoid C-3 methylase HpnR [Phycisphaerales bacterium]|nr:hopanoid C-3 methylase HpnR [Phycisphaerales bacterium]
MRVLLIHPGPLFYSEVYLRLEPLGVEYVATALENAGHEVRLLDLQVFGSGALDRLLGSFEPNAVGFSLNYLANVPEVLDLAKRVRARLRECFVFVGGHSASFVAPELVEHGAGAIDCVVQGEGEASVVRLLDAWPRIDGLPGAVTTAGTGPRPELVVRLDDLPPARHLTRRRRRYFIGELDPCASIEFTRGCPWDCTFCSAWTFYGRSYRKREPEAIAAELRSIREPNVFIVDDVAFVHPEHGMAIADAVERTGIRKRYYLETRCDVLVRNEEVFRRWARLGLAYMFLGFESLDAEQLQLFRKRVTPNQNFAALEVARRLGIDVAINLITDPAWTEEQFDRAIAWATEVPEIVHLTVATPYPGTELFHSAAGELATLDYRLFDIQHAVLPTRLPLRRFYEKLVESQAIINRKFMGWRTAVAVANILAGQVLRGQTNFLRMLFKFSRVYDARRQFADHERPVVYEMRPPRPVQVVANGNGLAQLTVRGDDLAIHQPPRRRPTAPIQG